MLYVMPMYCNDVQPCIHGAVVPQIKASLKYVNTCLEMLRPKLVRVQVPGSMHAKKEID